MSLGKPVVLPQHVHMDDDMRDFAISEAQKALETSNSEKVRLVTVARGLLHEIHFRKEVQVGVALHRWQELRSLCDP
jgi:hypothetical protein